MCGNDVYTGRNWEFYGKTKDFGIQFKELAGKKFPKEGRGAEMSPYRFGGIEGYHGGGGKSIKKKG